MLFFSRVKDIKTGTYEVVEYSAIALCTADVGLSGCGDTKATLRDVSGHQKEYLVEGWGGAKARKKSEDISAALILAQKSEKNIQATIKNEKYINSAKQAR